MDWIAEEVLPSIRKTGGYIKTNINDDEATIMAKALLVAQSTIDKNKARITELENKIEEQQDDVDFSNRLQSNNKKLYKMQEVADLLKLPYGNITLFRKLRENDILKVSNKPYQEHLNCGRFEVIIHEYFVNGSVKYSELTVATTKGIKWLHKNRYRFNLI